VLSPSGGALGLSTALARSPLVSEIVPTPVEEAPPADRFRLAPVPFLEPAAPETDELRRLAGAV
jgi:hypothetical protein